MGPLPGAEYPGARSEPWDKPLMRSKTGGWGRGGEGPRLVPFPIRAGSRSSNKFGARPAGAGHWGRMERSQTPQRGAGLPSGQIHQPSLAFIKCPPLMHFSPGHQGDSLLKTKSSGEKFASTPRGHSTGTGPQPRIPDTEGESPLRAQPRGWGRKGGQAEPQTPKPEESRTGPWSPRPWGLETFGLLSCCHPIPFLPIASWPWALSPETAGPSSRLRKDSFQHPLR